MIKGFFYGKEIVPISKNIEEEMKYNSTKCLKLLGFVNALCIPRNYLMGTVDMVIPIDSN